MTHVRPRVALLAIALATAPLGAQPCLGFHGFAGKPLRLDGTVTTGNDVTTLGADLAFGRSSGTGAFGSAGLGVATGNGHSALLVDGSIGTQVQMAPGTRSSTGAQLCPVASIQYQNGPNVGNIDVSTVQLAGGLALGTTLPLGTASRLAPFGTLSLAWRHASISSGSVDASDSKVGGLLDLGAGFIFTPNLTIRPMVRVPLGFDGDDARFGVTVGYGFGGNR